MATTLLRRKAAAEFAGLEVSGWLFTVRLCSRPPPRWSPGTRPSGWPGQRVHDATCSIGTELAALRETAALVVGSDIDEVRLAMARHNLGADVPLCRADALHPISRDTIVVLDPARRAGGRRRSTRAYLPPLDALAEVYAAGSPW